ncbi:phosphotransferase family protein [Nocardioides limicola]|uniref:phosphotransferase family protein n=1 Tax=Nocardioides limicola TaxID=2803368 RepID=UPI00193B4642|nr:phosphotransferase family protein [Nocardioides sp. DJM-14]
MTETPGLDPAALTDWWQRTLPESAPLAGPLSATLIAGGKSNLTYRVSDGQQSWVVRRPPLGHVLATAHDMSREHRVIAALADTGVPVPTAYAFCDDLDVLGAPFYVMADMPGTPYRSSAELAKLGPERTRAISTAMVDVLIALHGVDTHVVGLADFGRPEGFLTRQVRRWKKQLDASHNRELPAAEELHRRLAETSEAADAAAASRIGIVHGDFRLDNLLVDDDDRPTAVLDWEMATVGDTLTDLALLVVYGRLAVLLPGSVTDVSAAPGFLSETEIIDRYAAARDVDAPDLGFHLALASFKLATIVEGIHFRYLQGQTVGEGFDGIGAGTVPLLEAGLASLDHH